MGKSWVKTEELENPLSEGRGEGNEQCGCGESRRKAGGKAYKVKSSINDFCVRFMSWKPLLGPLRRSEKRGPTTGAFRVLASSAANDSGKAPIKNENLKGGKVKLCGGGEKLKHKESVILSEKPPSQTGWKEKVPKVERVRETTNEK